MFSDDRALLIKTKTLSNLEIDFSLQLWSCYQYLTSNNLHVNPAKTERLFFSNNGHIEMEPLVFINDIEIILDEESK